METQLQVLPDLLDREVPHAPAARSTLVVVSSIELPDDVAAALAAAAAERGISVADLIAELVAVHPKPAGLDGFVGCMDSGDPDWAGTDTKVLRKQAAARTS